MYAVARLRILYFLFVAGIAAAGIVPAFRYVQWGQPPAVHGTCRDGGKCGCCDQASNRIAEGRCCCAQEGSRHIAASYHPSHTCECSLRSPRDVDTTKSTIPPVDKQSIAAGAAPFAVKETGKPYGAYHPGYYLVGDTEEPPVPPPEYPLFC